jgi:hypothetical protein
VNTDVAVAPPETVGVVQFDPGDGGNGKNESESRVVPGPLGPAGGMYVPVFLYEQAGTHAARRSSPSPLEIKQGRELFPLVVVTVFTAILLHSRSFALE